MKTIGLRKFLAYESGLIVGSILQYLTNSDSAWYYIIIMTGLLYGFNISSKWINFKKNNNHLTTINNNSNL